IRRRSRNREPKTFGDRRHCRNDISRINVRYLHASFQCWTARTLVGPICTHDIGEKDGIEEPLFGDASQFNPVIQLVVVDTTVSRQPPSAVDNEARRCNFESIYTNLFRHSYPSVGIKEFKSP